MAAQLPAIGVLLGHYRLLEEIGKGGMGVVFRARDEQLHRDVAIKILPPGIFPDEKARQRFRREARVLARLNHPNIAMAFDLGEQAGVDYLVTEYVPGITLDAKLAKGPLPQKNVVELGIQLAKGLAAAHREQIVHRDLKPGNLRLTKDNELKILDFGLAHWREPVSDMDETITAVGDEPVGGTLPYMAPEQIRCEEVDERADIWGAGAVLYEMATGERPFPIAQRLKLLDAIQHLGPRAPSTCNRQLSPALDAIILKALDKDPERRYQSARELGVDLARLLPTTSSSATLADSGFVPVKSKAHKWLWASFAVMFMLGSYLGYRSYLKPTTNLTNGGRLLAVLPIDCSGQDDKTTALVTGLTETVTAKLADASLKSLELISPRELRDFRIKTPEQAWTEFGTDLVLEGTARRVGDEIRINSSLVNPKTHREIAARIITARLTDVFQLEDEVSNEMVSMVNAAGVPGQPAQGNRKEHNPEAYASYLRGHGFLQEYQKPESIALAIAEFRSAIATDPEYADAYAGLGQAYLLGYQQLNHDSDWVDKAQRNCSQSLQVQQTAVGLICLGDVYNETGKYDLAVQEFQRATQIGPQDQDALRGQADALERLGNPSAAEAAYKRAIELKPNYWGVYSWLGKFYYDQARYADAITQFKKVIELAPSNYRGYSNLGAMYVAQGEYNEALLPLNRSIAIRPNLEAFNNLGNAYFALRRFSEAADSFQRGLNLDDSDWLLWGNLGDAIFWSKGPSSKAEQAYKNAIARVTKKLQVNPKDATLLAFSADYNAMIGKRDKALAQMEQALAVAPSDAEVRFRAAIVHNHFGETDQSLSSLEAAASLGYSLQVIRDTPDFDHLRSNVRYRALTQRKN